MVNIGITYCDKHQLEFEARQKQRHQEYKQQRQDKREQAFYSCDDWLKTRDYVRGLYNGLCLYSLFVLKDIVPCDDMHHIVELKDVEGWELRLEVDNLIPLSESVHQEIHRMYNAGNKMEVQNMLRKLKVEYECEYRNNM